MKEGCFMEQNVRGYLEEQARALLAAPSCCPPLKAAAQSWLDALGTEREAGESRKLVSELEADIMPIDGLLAFLQTEAAAGYFGAARAADMLAHSQERKAAGAVYCDCPACAAAEAMLEKKDALLGG